MSTDKIKPEIVDRLRAWANASDSVGRHCANAADDEIKRLRAEVDDLRRIINRDSAELRNLCEERDEARRERDELRRRIDAAPRGIITNRRSDGIANTVAVKESDIPSDWWGKRVRLVVDDGAEG